MKILNLAEKKFIEQNKNKNIQELLLATKSSNDFDAKFAIGQIAGFQKIKDKLPTWYLNLDLILPPSISLEQSSSEQTASFKASLMKGKTLLDLTLGMGIDAWKMSQNFENFIGIEQQEQLAEITKQNLAYLNNTSTIIEVKNQDALQFLKENKNAFSWIYLDPARRNNLDKKVVFLQDCDPNIFEIQTKLFEFSDNILLKTSPMLDIDLAINQLKGVKKVYIVALENEVKELLFVLEKSFCGQAKLICINLKKEKIFQSFEFYKQSESQIALTYSSPLRFLYEPNATILKAGAFKSIAQQYGIKKIQQHSHLYTSEDLVDNFIGRSFEILSTQNVDAKKVNAIVKGKANITTRNFPIKVEALRKKLGLKDGGDFYIFATTDYTDKKILIICKKISN